MMKKRLTFMLAAVIFIAACSGASEAEYMDVPKEVDRITVKGNGVSIEKDGRFIENEVILEESGEMDVFLKALENSSVHKGPMTDEGETFKLVLSYSDGTSRTILLWIDYDIKTGRVQGEDYTGPIYLLEREDVESILELVEEKVKNKKTGYLPVGDSLVPGKADGQMG
jgi:hypothetical protein